jgi:iron complex outermembrane receptor protein
MDNRLKTLYLNNTAYYNFLDGNYDFDLNNFLGLPSTEEMYNYGFRHHFAGYFNNLNWHYNQLKLNIGTHINSFNRRHLGTEATLGELYRNKGFKNEFSSFMKVLYDYQQFAFYGDLQYRYAEFDYEGTAPFEKMTWNFINPRVGVGYNISKNSNLYYSYGSTGREPTRNDIFIGEDELPIDNQGNAIFQTIRPEYVQNHEFGFKAIHKNWFLMANVYYMSFKNEIVLNGQYGPNGLPLHSNVAKSYRSGLEIDFKLKFSGHFYVQSNMALSKNRIKENSVEFSPILTPELITNHKIGFEKNQLSLGAELKYQNYSYIDFGNETKLPDFLLVNLFANYSIKKFDIQLRINNITNKTILSNGYIGIDGTPLYFVQAPFNLSGGISWSF